MPIRHAETFETPDGRKIGYLEQGTDEAQKVTFFVEDDGADDEEELNPRQESGSSNTDS